MIKTEKKYWVNGYRKYGSDFNTYALNIKNIGVMFCWNSSFKMIKELKKIFEVSIYKLI